MSHFMSAVVAAVAMFGADVDEARARDCRSCGEKLRHTFVDLGTSPLCQRHVTPAHFDEAEATYPLHAYVCHGCFLVQLPAYVAREKIFDADYGYFSSYSDSWLKHAEDYVATMIRRFGFGGQSKVVEVASNDGYLLQYFARRRAGPRHRAHEEHCRGRGPEGNSDGDRVLWTRNRPPPAGIG